jgi:hypothetical protein
MSIRKTLLATAMAVAAFAAIPVFAVANPTMHRPANPSFTVHGPALQFTGGVEVACSTLSGLGKFDTSTTGKIEFTFTNCAVSFLKCTSNPPNITGTITTTELSFQLVTITNGKPGIRIAPGAGNHFASFKCVISNVGWGGSGLIGEIISLCNIKSSSFGFKFAGIGTVQNHRTVDGSEVKYSLTSSMNGGESLASAFDATGIANFVSGGEGTLTC